MDEERNYTGWMQIGQLASQILKILQTKLDASMIDSYIEPTKTEED